MMLEMEVLIPELLVKEPMTRTKLLIALYAVMDGEPAWSTIQIVLGRLIERGIVEKNELTTGKPGRKKVFYQLTEENRNGKKE